MDTLLLEPSGAESGRFSYLLRLMLRIPVDPEKRNESVSALSMVLTLLFTQEYAQNRLLHCLKLPILGVSQANPLSHLERLILIIPSAQEGESRIEYVSAAPYAYYPFGAGRRIEYVSAAPYAYYPFSAGRRIEYVSVAPYAHYPFGAGRRTEFVSAVPYAHYPFGRGRRIQYVSFAPYAYYPFGAGRRIEYVSAAPYAYYPFSAGRRTELVSAAPYAHYPFDAGNCASSDL